MKQRNLIPVVLAVLFLALPLYTAPDKPPQEVRTLKGIYSSQENDLSGSSVSPVSDLTEQRAGR